MKYSKFKPLHFLKKQSITTCIGAFFAGALLPLAFSPFHYFPLAIVSPALLLGLWFNTSPRDAFRRGWWYGLGYFGVGTSWIYVSIHQYGGTNSFFSGMITLLFVAILGFFPAIQGYFLQRFFGNNHETQQQNNAHVTLKALLYFPASWLFIEWIRTWFLTGFPWLQLGHSQVESPIAGFAPLFGVFGVTTIVVFLSGCLYLFVSFFFRRQYLKAAVILFIVSGLFFAGSTLKTRHWTSVQPKPLRVALVQGNVPQSLKWSSGELIRILKLYPRLSQPIWKNNDLVVWPEAAITLPLPFSAKYFDQLLKCIQRYPVNLITGIPAQSINGFKYYNAMMLLGRGGTDIYYKRYLVPFGEYLPLENSLRGLINFFDLPMSDFISGNQGGEMNLKNKQLSVAPFVCYEIAYPNAILTTAAQANLMVVLSNDTWFGNSLAPWQHLQIAQFAALAAERYMLVSTNDGITAIIDPDGKILSQAPRFQQAVLQGKVFLTVGKTPWIAFGHTYLLMCLGLITVIGRIGENYLFRVRNGNTIPTSNH